MKIQADIVIKNLKGESFKDDKDELTVGMALSNILTYDKVAGKYKGYILAKKFMENTEVDLDAADVALVKRAVESTEAYINNVLLGALIEILDAAKPTEAKS